MVNESLIRVERVRKKFCRSLRKSLEYGLRDILADLFRRRAEELELREGEFFAVDDVSFELHRGECVGLIGRNGAGKTTLLKMLNGLIKPDAGRIRVRGRVGALIALGAGFNALLSGRENIYVNGAILGMGKAEIDSKLEQIIEFSELRDFIDSPIQSYSSGMVVRLGFAIAVHSDPDILLLDEVLAVGDSAFQAKCYNTLSQFRKRGVGFILVSHNLSSIDCYCDRVVYLRRGRCVFSGGTRDGIAAYNRDSVNDAGKPDDESGSNTVLGTGKVRIREVMFLDGAGKRVSGIESGAAVTLRISYECQCSDCVPTVLDLCIKDQAGLFYHNLRAAEFSELEGCGFIDVRFDAIPASNQRLFFSICLLGLGNWEVFDWKSDFPLAVNGNPDAQGRVHLTFDCRVEQEAAPLVH